MAFVNSELVYKLIDPTKYLNSYIAFLNSGMAFLDLLSSDMMFLSLDVMELLERMYLLSLKL